MSQQKPACTEHEIQVTKHDLPLSCPTKEMILWNSHPRVYLPIEETGKEKCPYCGTVFVLSQDDQ